MSHFTKESLKFLKQLESNNNREWFTDNKQRYLEHIKEPFESFIGDLIEEMAPYFDGINITAKEAIFRIYRDVRFSKDKSPYKTKISAIVSPGGRKDKTIPGIYLEITAKTMGLYSGLYQPDTKQLKNVRYHIIHNMDEFKRLINETKFVKEFGEIQGEKNKRIASEFEADAELQPLLYNKQFYYFTTWPAESILEYNIIQKISKTFSIAKPLSEFLYEGTF